MANTPAEITHLLEEIQAKDLQISAFKDEIQRRDALLQKWTRLNGGHVPHPKEDAFSKTISDCYDKCEILQAEKCGLSDKAVVILDRQIRRLDVGLRGLSAREEFPSDWGGPTSLGTTGTHTPIGAAPSGPLQVVSGNIGVTGGAPNIANAAQIRMAQSAAGGTRTTQATPAVAAPRSQREGSSEANKRRRLNPSLNIPATASSLRQSSLGPGTPKAGTPIPPSGAVTSRAGSAQPVRPGVAVPKKGGALAPPGRKVAPHQAGGGRKRIRTSTTNKKGSRRHQLARDRDRGTPSTNASDASGSDEEGHSASPTPSSLPRSQVDGPADKATRTRGSRNTEADANDDEGEEDETLYCYCQKVSFGDMVGCDNEDCEYQWFHWGCVQLKSEPEGEWLCPTCRKGDVGAISVE